MLPDAEPPVEPDLPSVRKRIDEPMDEPLPEPMTDDEAPSRPEFERAQPLVEPGMAERFRRESEEECIRSVKQIRDRRLQDIDLSIAVSGEEGRDYPRSCPVEDLEFEPRQWPLTHYTWTASSVCHKPLYFEQPDLERYGHSLGHYMQPLASGAHFFLTVPILPYKMGLMTPNECVYPLGHYRPGSCAPYLVPPFPVSARGGLFQAGAAVGAAFLIP